MITPIAGNHSDSDDGRAEHLAIRHFIEHPIQGWQTLPNKRAMALYSGAEGIVELASQTVRVVTAHVLMEGKEVRSLARLQIEHWKFDGDGRVDQQAAMRVIVEKLDANRNGQCMGDGCQSVALAENEIRAIILALGLP